jgi:hypothetical protein
MATLFPVIKFPQGARIEEVPAHGWTNYERSSRDAMTVSDNEPRMPDRVCRTVSRLMSSSRAAAHSTSSKQSEASASSAKSDRSPEHVVRLRALGSPAAGGLHVHRQLRRFSPPFPCSESGFRQGFSRLSKVADKAAGKKRKTP